MWNHKFKDVEMIPFSPDLIGDWDTWSSYYVSFHKGKPWNEYLWCELCNSRSEDVFGPLGSIGFDRAAELGLDPGKGCPKCGYELELFWSPRRIQNYVQDSMSYPGFNRVVGFISDQLLFWYWGYTKTPVELLEILGKNNSFYVDVIAVEPRTRKDYLYEASTYFLHWLQQVVDEINPSYFTLRTHKDASHVIGLALLVGFQATQVASKNDQERLFWKREVTEEVQKQAFKNLDNFPRFKEASQRRKLES